MKKLGLLVMPLMAISLLASCKVVDAVHNFHFIGTNCTINGESDYSHNIFEKDKNVQYTIVPDTGYKLPETVEGVEYNPSNGVITISEIKNDIELRVEATHIPQPGITHTIYLDPAGGTITGETILEDLPDGDPVETAPNISRDGYDVSEVKWYTEPDGGGDEFKFGPKGIGTDVVTDYFLHAKWGDITKYTVHFKDAADDSEVSEEQTVEFNHKVQRPVNPTKEGCTFDKWYAEDKQTEFDFDTPLTDEKQEITIYAKFTLNECHITYITNGGTLGTHIDSVKYGNPIPTAPTVTRAGYDASQVTWWLDEAMTSKQFTFNSTLVKGDINLYAKWGNIKTYTVKFYDGSKDLELDQTVNYGEKVQRPVNPTKDGYTFKDWYSDAEFGSEYPFGTPLTGDSTEVNIYAKFTLNECHITYVLSGCTIDGTESVNYGATIPAAPTVKIGEKEIHPTWWTTPTFEGTQFTFGTSGTEVKGDLILYGKYVPTAESFVNDSWDLFTSYIDGKTFGEIAGEDSPYHDEFISKEGKAENTFVGLSRTLEFTDEKGESIVCHALVVDENPSAEANDNKFTFMITDLGLETTFAENNNFYKESYINSYLDILLWMFPVEVKQHMQTVSIDCYNAHPDVGDIDTLDTSLYIPSASQIFGESVSTDPIVYPTENDQFAYFENGDKTILNDAWLRTPDKDTQELSLYVDNASSVSEDEITASHKLMPVFIIK